MKRWKLWGSVFVALVMVLGIVFATPILGPGSNSEALAVEPPDFWLWAGQTNLAGTGNVTNDDESMTFTIATDCAISKIHIKILDRLPVEGDQSSPGQFPYKFEYTIPKTGVFDVVIPFTPGDWGSSISILLHADVICGFYEGNTAWASDRDTSGASLASRQVPGQPWAYYFRYANSD